MRPRCRFGLPAALLLCAWTLGLGSLSQPAIADGASGSASSFAGSSLTQDFILHELASAPLLAFRPVGSTSTVFKATMRSTIAAAFKVTTSRRAHGPRSEVAAYRLARCLGLANVVPAVSRSIPVAALRAGLSADQVSRWPQIAERLSIGRDGLVQGAAIYWVDGMQDPKLDPLSGQARIAAMLRLDNPLAPQQQALAAQLSSMLAFDYLIGNWDRFSGGNLKSDASGQIIYLRDHDAAFAPRLSEALQRPMLKRLLRVERIGRGFYTALRALSRDTFQKELAQDPGFGPGQELDAQRVGGLFDRRQTVLSHISALIEEHGEANVLVFP
jgi:hypothetical protein